MTEVDVRQGMNVLKAPKMTPNTPNKRTFDDLESTDNSNAISTASPTTGNGADMANDHTTTAHIVTADSLQDTPSNSHSPSGNSIPSTADGKSANPPKRRRLSLASKEAKERQKAEEKAKKVEERKLREEEKRKREEEKEEERKSKRREREKREEEKEEKKRQRDEEKQAKEDEKRKREEEKQKKAKSQMKLNAFFTKPSPNTSTPNLSETSSAGVGTGMTLTATSVTIKEDPTLKSDFELDFPPFFVQSHVKLAPSHRFERDTSALDHARRKLDSICEHNFGLGDSAATQVFNPSELFEMISYKRLHGSSHGPSVKDIIMRLQDPEYRNVDLTESANPIEASNKIEKLLRKMPIKVLSFREDVRPPYQGTFSRRMQPQSARKLCRNPFWQGVPGFNYDYDSEAEWEEPEEGEDIGSEGEDEMSEDGEDDMDDFLDDGEDDATNVKRRMVVGDLEPRCTGIIWTENLAGNAALTQHRIEIISDAMSFPIDPFFDYWKPKTKIESINSPFKVPQRPSPTNKSTLQQSQNPLSTMAKGSKKTMQTAMVEVTNPKPRTLFPEDQLADFKRMISGSNLTKAGLIEVLKKGFPKVSKDVIKTTLTSIAARQGQKEVDKKWVLR